MPRPPTESLAYLTAATHKLPEESTAIADRLRGTLDKVLT